MKVFFAIGVLPALMINEGYKKLKSTFAKHGIEFDWFHMSLIFGILLLIILLLNGYRW